MKKKTTKVKRFSITLPEREGELLKQYAKEHGITRPMALRRLVRQSLRQYKIERANTLQSVPKNQLNLFDSIQVDIFDNTSKASD